MKDRIEIYSPVNGKMMGYLLWYSDGQTVSGTASYAFSDNGLHAMGETVLIYIAGQIKRLNEARRRQNQK